MEDLKVERAQVQHLLGLATQVDEAAEEYKFKKLREFLGNPKYKSEKIIIFTEHIDTLDFQEETTEDANTEPEEGTGSKVKLKPWQQRKRKTMGYEAAGGRPVPLIDQVHRLMHQQQMLVGFSSCLH